MKTTVVVLLIATLGMLFCRENYTGHDASPQAMVNKCELRVSLGQKIDDVQDLRWAKLGSGEYQTYRLFTAEDKCEITVGLPSGKSVNYKPLNIDLVQTGGQLDAIYLRLHPQVSAFPDALRNLEREVAGLFGDKSVACTAGLQRLREISEPDPHVGELVGCYVELEPNVKARIGVSSIINHPNINWITFLEFTRPPTQ